MSETGTPYMSNLGDTPYMAEHQLNEVGRPTMYDTLDGGKGALDMYAGHQWLQNRPPPREEPRPPSPPKPFSGTPHAIARNDALISALSVSAAVLHDRYHEFGQIGVLAWCAEFEELVTEIKSLGFSNEMADATRSCALQACRDVLRVDLDLNVQLIIMYLARQVFRLREFLGEDEDEDDYPCTTISSMPPIDDNYGYAGRPF